MKNFKTWWQSSKSDFFLFVIFLILLNFASSSFYFRADLTAKKSYSLSPVSAEALSSLSSPLKVSVFFSSNLPAPYNTIGAYVKDMMAEYKNHASSNFSYRIYDMNKEESVRAAESFGVKSVQIQEIKNNEVGFLNAYMGVAVSYKDNVEAISEVKDNTGFEYDMTTLILKMISIDEAVSLLAENERISMTLYKSRELERFNIAGLSELEGEAKAQAKKLNEKYRDKIDFKIESPSSEEAQKLAKKYGVQTVNWSDDGGKVHSSSLALVLEWKGKFQIVPLSVARSLFGYAVSGLENLGENANEALKSIFSSSRTLSYVTGHGESPLTNEQGAPSALQNLLKDTYAVKEVNLEKEDIPVSATALIVNGPKSAFSEAELYKIDQYLMRGGNAVFFIDPFEYESQGYYAPMTFTPIHTGLEEILGEYGVKSESAYVCDKNCFVSVQQNGQKMEHYLAPLLQKKNFAKHVIGDNLNFVVFLQSSPLSLTSENKDVCATVLASSSASSWLLKDNITLMPTLPYDEKDFRSYPLAVLLEGKFKSAFKSSPKEMKGGELSAESYAPSSTQNGKIIVFSTSQIASEQLLDSGGKEPVSMFVRNAVDYAAGNESLCRMRTKTLSLNPLSVKNVALVKTAKAFNQFGISVLIALFGVYVYFRIKRYRRLIEEKYAKGEEEK